MQKRILTQEDLDANPELVEKGLKVGDEIDIPDENAEPANENTESDGDNDDTGGSTPPLSKNRP